MLSKLLCVAKKRSRELSHLLPMRFHMFLKKQTIICGSLKEFGSNVPPNCHICHISNYDHFPQQYILQRHEKQSKWCSKGLLSSMNGCRNLVDQISQSWSPDMLLLGIEVVLFQQLKMARLRRSSSGNEPAVHLY